jgi:hypothetical protein
LDVSIPILSRDGFFPIKGQYRIFGVGSDPSYGIQSNHVVRSKVYWISWPKLNGTLDCLVLSIRDVDQLLYRIRHDNAPLDVATFCCMADSNPTDGRNNIRKTSWKTFRKELGPLISSYCALPPWASWRCTGLIQPSI